jgi:AcrR family transcriptional regulator
MASVNSYNQIMPTPDKTSLDAIVSAARDLLETEGLAGLTMQAVAHRVGVRAPSLYKRVQGRDQLIRLVAEATLAELALRLDSATTAAEVMDDYRIYSHERPAAFQLCMGAGAPTSIADESHWKAASAAVIRIGGELAGADHALDAARTLTAWAVGFITIELNRGFNLGGDVEQAWEFGRTRVTESVTRH